MAALGREHSKVVARGATAMEGAGLEHRAHLAGRDIEVAVALSADQGLAAGWSDEAEQHPQHRRLARAVRAQQADDAPWLDLEADVIDSADPTEVLGQCVNGEIEHARDSCRRRGAHGILTSVTSTAVERSATKNGRSSRASSGEAASTSHQIACSPQRHEARAPL